MKRSAGILLLLLLLCSCGNNQKIINFETLNFNSLCFSVSLGSEELKGAADFDSSTLSVKICEPAELENFVFNIDSSGIRCTEEGIECNYTLNDFNGSLLFYDLYDLIIKACGSADFEKRRGGYLFSDEKNILLFDTEGKLISAEINNCTIMFT